MIYLPIIGSFLEAAGVIIEKKLLKRHNYKDYTTYIFAGIVLVLLPFIYFFYSIDKAAFSLINILLFALVVLTSVSANILIFYSLKREKVTEIEPIWIMQPLFTIILAFIIFQSERNWNLIALALIASVTLVLSHVKKHHLKFDKYIWAAIIGCFLFSVELIASKPILQYYNPFMFYFLRCFFILAICYALFRPNGKDLNKKSIWMILFLGAMWAIYRSIVYYGYETIGVVFTTTLFILSPVLMMIFASIFLKEKLKMRNVIATLIILACVIASIFIRN